MGDAGFFKVKENKHKGKQEINDMDRVQVQTKIVDLVIKKRSS